MSAELKTEQGSMQVASKCSSDAIPPPDLLPPSARSLDVQVSIHDSSRFEWQVLLPLPHSGSVPYQIETEFEIPSSALSGRSPWDLLQSFTRLDADSTPSVSDGSLSALRHKVMALARMLERARLGFARHCRETVDAARGNEGSTAHEYLTPWLDSALGAVAASRQQLAIALPDEPAEFAKERSLADEFISVKLLESLADSQQVLKKLEETDPTTDEQCSASLKVADERLSAALEAELAYRRAHGFIVADTADPRTLEQYVERAGRLKKHFQEGLALEREAYPLDDRFQQWVATFSALIAGMIVFGVQFALGRWALGTQLSSGLAVLILLAGITYAARDRIKEMGRAWITGRVYRMHAQRMVICRLSSQDGSKKNVILRAREWANETTMVRPDPLNPEGGSMRVTVVHHLHRAHLIANATIAASGAQRIRHVFRYDLSPLFSRLQNPLKPVPVIDPTTRHAIFVDAPRRYQLPVHVRASMQEMKQEVDVNLVVDKLGISRLEQQGSIASADATKLR